MIYQLTMALIQILANLQPAYAERYYPNNQGAASGNIAYYSFDFGICCSSPYSCLVGNYTAICNTEYQWLTGSCTDKLWNSDVCPNLCSDF